MRGVTPGPKLHHAKHRAVVEGGAGLAARGVVAAVVAYREALRCRRSRTSGRPDVPDTTLVVISSKATIAGPDSLWPVTTRRTESDMAGSVRTEGRDHSRMAAAIAMRCACRRRAITVRSFGAAGAQADVAERRLLVGAIVRPYFALRLSGATSGEAVSRTILREVPMHKVLWACAMSLIATGQPALAIDRVAQVEIGPKRQVPGCVRLFEGARSARSSSIPALAGTIRNGRSRIGVTACTTSPSRTAVCAWTSPGPQWRTWRR